MLAHDVAALPLWSRAPEIALLAHSRGLDIDLVAGAYFAIGAILGLDRLRGLAAGIAADQHWDRLAIRRIADTPDGRNINEGCGSLHLGGLQRLVAERHLDLGVAFDGDADRALFVDALGRLVDGDVTLLILADEVYDKARYDTLDAEVTALHQEERRWHAAELELSTSSERLRGRPAGIGPDCGPKKAKGNAALFAIS